MKFSNLGRDVVGKKFAPAASVAAVKSTFENKCLVNLGRQTSRQPLVNKSFKITDDFSSLYQLTAIKPSVKTCKFDKQKA
jgi:hypothetical protein